MRYRKVYGESKVETCMFCESMATKINEGLPVCSRHSNKSIILKCACGKILMPMNGKFGVFFNCVNCGNINMRKAIEINNINK